MKFPSGFSGIFRTDEAARAVYSEAAGIHRVIPRAVAVPSDGDDVQALVAWAHAESVPLVPRGSGSSMAGGAVGEGVVVDLSRLTEIDDTRIEDGVIRVGPGVIRADVDRRAGRANLRFPVDPSSGAFCTIGGMVATNAAGARSLLHGSTREWVAALDCVFDNGARATVRRGAVLPYDVPAIARFSTRGEPGIRDLLRTGSLQMPAVKKNSSGYDVTGFSRTGEVTDLLVGSEGTLALFVGIELRLIDAAGATGAAFAAFDSLDRAAVAALRARESGASACELLDRTFLGIAAAAGRPLPGAADTEAVLIAEVEGLDAHHAADRARRLGRALHAAGATMVSIALDRAAETELWDLRHSASPALARLDQTLRSLQFIEDAAVPPERLAEYIRGVRQILDRHAVRGVIFGHAGDAHVHVNPLVDLSQPGWRSAVSHIFAETTDLVSRLGGTLSGEHGDGRLRTPSIEHVWGRRAADAFALVKRCFDPKAIFNPGVKTVAGAAPALTDGVKYDPQLPPLPAGARDALDRVARDRAYASFRLDLLGESVGQRPSV